MPELHHVSSYGPGASPTPPHRPLATYLGTVTSTPRSERLAARVAGVPYDAHIVQRLEATLGAVGMMVLITECHPFDDGNGRIARLMANAELSIAGQVRVVIPTSFRNNYLASLTALSSGNGHGQSLHAVMDFTQRWVAHLNWATFEHADEQVRATNAYLDPAEAEGSGRRLRLPT